MSAMKLCQERLARMFVDSSITFNKADSHAYSDLVAMSNKYISLEWSLLLGDSGISHLFFNFQVTRVFARYHNKQSRQHIFVI